MIFDYFMASTSQKLESLRANSIAKVRLDHCFLSSVFHAGDHVESQPGVQKKTQLLLTTGVWHSNAKLENISNCGFLFRLLDPNA